MRRPFGFAVGLAFLVGAGVVTVPAISASAAPSHGLSLFGDLKYGPDFTHFEYANPSAPKGGTMRLSAIGTFDSLNPYIVKGVSATGMSQTFDTLMLPSEDEPGSEYGLVAESADLAPDRKTVLYTLRKEARFQDGTPIMPDDVIWTFDTLRDKGQPMYRSYYGDVEKVEREGERGVRFLFKSAENRELPQIVGQMPILSKKYWEGRDFAKTTLDAPLGSGPYKVEVGRSRALDHLSPRARLLGGRSAGSQGGRECRRDPLRLLPRWDDRARSAEGRPIRRAAGELVESLGDRV